MTMIVSIKATKYGLIILTYDIVFLSILVSEVKVMLSGNVSISDGVTLIEGNDDIINISIAEPNFRTVLVSVTVSTDTAEIGEKGREFLSQY